jgi:hypothetical protein
MVKLPSKELYAQPSGDAMGKPAGRIFFDLNGRHFTIGTFEDLDAEKIVPVEGMTLPFYNDGADESGNTDNLLFEGVIHSDKQADRWAATVDEKSYRHESEERRRRCGNE